MKTDLDSDGESSMRRLWCEIDGAWTGLPLKEPAYRLDEGVLRPLAPGESAGERVLLLRTQNAHLGWLVMTDVDKRVWINGIPILSGLHALKDRDQIHVPGVATFYFGADHPGDRVEAYAGAGRCLRCRRPIKANAPAVRCGGCGTWFHAEKCRQYSPTCPVCGHPTDVDPGPAWTPDELEEEVG